MKRKITLGVSILAIVVCLAFTGVALADWQGPINCHYPNTNFNHGWGIGCTERVDKWYQYWDSGQGRYTYYRIEPTSWASVYVALQSPSFIHGVYACLHRSDGTERVYNGAAVRVTQGQSYFKYWPPSQDTFPKPPGTDPVSFLMWSYSWPIPPTVRYNWTEIWYGSQTYNYGYNP